MTRFVLVLTFCLFASTGAKVAIAEDFTIAAAADLNFAFREIVADYERTTGEHVRLVFGSSGNFYSQIQNGAPFDLYFSADIAYPKKLIDEGLAVPGSLYQYATGRIVLWVLKESPIKVENGMEVLLDPTSKKIAIGNPKHAPYGRAAVSAMEYYKVHDRVKDKFVLGENISQTAQFVQSGNVDIGIIALSLALAPTVQPLGRYWLIPEEAHPAIDQGAAIIKASKKQESARKFLDHLQTPAMRAIMKRYGFVLPGEDAGAR